MIITLGISTRYLLALMALGLLVGLAVQLNSCVASDETQIKAIQKRLIELHYYAWEVDGKVTDKFTYALTAFQKLNGLKRDGQVRPEVIEALKNPIRPKANQQHAGIYVEADLERQIMTVYRDGKTVRILHISSGSGKRYREPEGGYGIAKTPIGTYKFTRHIGKIHKGHLGTLWYPVYFHTDRYAVHGATSVPPYPASHGCLRIPIPDSKWFEQTVPLGSTIFVSKTALETLPP